MNDFDADFNEETGEYLNVVAYGSGDMCAIYNRRCPKCGRYTKPRDKALVNECVGAGEALADCHKCGEVRLQFVCWAGE